MVCFPSRRAIRCIDYIRAPFSDNSACQGDTVPSAWCGNIIIIRVLQIERVSRLPNHSPVLQSSYSTLKSPSPSTAPKRAYVTCVCAFREVCACVGVSAMQYRPGTTLTLTTLPVRPSVHLNHPAVVNYQGSIALTHKAQVQCVSACVCACGCACV